MEVPHELYLQFNQLKRQIEEYERAQEIERIEENSALVGRCFKNTTGRAVFYPYLKIIDARTAESNKVFVLKFYSPFNLSFNSSSKTFFQQHFFSIETEIISVITARYTEISEEEFNNKAIESLQQLLKYEHKKQEKERNNE